MADRNSQPTASFATRILLSAGILGPVIFAGLVVTQGLMHEDFNHVSMPVSALAALPDGWLQNTNFYVFGLMMIAFAAGFRMATKAASGRIPAWSLFALCGLGLVISGLFPMERDGVDLVEPPGHVIGALMTFIGAGVGLVAAAQKLKALGSSKQIVRLVTASGVVTLIVFFSFPALALPENAPLHDVLGIVQRVAIGSWFIGLIVTSIELVRQK